MEDSQRQKIVDIVAKNMYNNIVAFLSEEIFDRAKGFGQPDGTYAIFRYQKVWLLEDVKRSCWGDGSNNRLGENIKQLADAAVKEIIAEIDNGTI